uniref:rhomboid protease n=1 Tax=Glossina austeni TaxID=7395 RepID=A0A1A9V404_GLOAU
MFKISGMTWGRSTLDYINTFVSLSLFAFHAISMRKADLMGGSIPICLSTSTSYSLLIYRPDKRYELWRFVTYMFLHDGWCHLGFNLLIQLLLGLPLEMVHGSARLASIYFSGVLAGSLGTSIIDPEVCLVGASGGAYALLAAHLANVMINYHQMRYGVLRLAVILFFASCDVGFAVYTRYAEDYPAVSFIAHLSGALSGLTIGLLVLKNFEQKLHEQLLWWIALGIYTACIIFAIIFNIINSAVMQSLKVEQIYVTETFYNGFQFPFHMEIQMDLFILHGLNERQCFEVLHINCNVKLGLLTYRQSVSALGSQRQ